MKFATRFRKPKSKTQESEEPEAPSDANVIDMSGDQDGATTADDKEKSKDDAPPVSFFALFRFATPYEKALNILGIFAAVVGGSAQPLMTLIFGNLAKSFVSFGSVQINSDGTIDTSSLQAAESQFKTIIARYCLVLFGMGTALCFMIWFYMFVWSYTSEYSSKRIREEYLKAVLRQEIAFFDTVGAGEITTRIQSDSYLVQVGMSEKVPLTVQFTTSFFAGFILAYARSWRLALALTSILPCISISGYLLNFFVSKWTKLNLEYVAESGTVAEEVISTIRTTQAFGAQEKLAEIYDVQVRNSQKADVNSAIAQGVGIGVLFFFVYSADALSFNFGTTLVLRGQADVGIVVNVFMAILIGSFSLAVAAPQIQAIMKGCAAAGRLFATIDRVSAIDSASSSGLKPSASEVKGGITLEDVSFNYPSRPDVAIFKDISMTFEAGKTTALVGPSGSGKSTIVNLIERFYDPLSGVVKLDGVDLRELNVAWLRSQIGLVSQEPVLFSTTIRENVAYGLLGSALEGSSEEQKDALIRVACAKANADGFISKLPQGYETLVGERGYLLSGGQKQRIAIARAIVSDPRVLLLDEATSALDTESEGVVQNALEKAAAGRTTIVIAHRLSTIRNADKICVMGDGIVLEQGTHNELLSIPDGHYGKLVTAQKLRDAGATDGARRIIGVQEKDIPETKEVDITDSVIPLKRKATTTSTRASEKVEKRENEYSLAPTRTPDLSLFYVFSRFAKLNQQVWGSYALGTLAAIGTGALYPAFGIIYAKAVTTFQLNPNDPNSRHQLRHQADLNALYFFIIGIASGIVISLQQALFASAATKLAAKLRSLCFRAILVQDVEYFDQDTHRTGALTADLSGNPQKVQGLAGLTLGAIVQGIATILCGVIIGLCFAPKLAAVGIACIPLVISGGYAQLQVTVLKDQKNKKAHEDAANQACESTSAIRTVAALTRENQCCIDYSKNLEEPLRRTNRSALISTSFFAFTQAMAFYSIALASWYGSKLISNGTYNVNQFYVSLMSVTFGSIQAGNVFAFVPDISAARGAGSDIIKLLDSKPNINAPSVEGKYPKPVRGHIRAQDVQFEYPTRPNVTVLRGLSLEVRPGSHVGIAGASGCGKSTIIQLLERFYDPEKGTIYVDDQPIDDLNVKEYRDNMALVSQEPTLYAGTIKFNILLGSVKPVDQVTDAELEAACKDANILEFIKSLPDGFNTQVGSKGAQLSGGQKQRIAIARALIRDPKILLLDEATSALDSHSEKVVQEALDQAAKGRTTITIAHRLATIQNADCIYYIKDGVVLESGTHDQLISQHGAYFESTQLQHLSRTQ